MKNSPIDSILDTSNKKMNNNNLYKSYGLFYH